MRVCQKKAHPHTLPIMSKHPYYTTPLCLTHRCNLNCIYCFEKHDAKHEMSYETAVDCIQRVLKSTEMDSTIEFIFWVGSLFCVSI